MRKEAHTRHLRAVWRRARSTRWAGSAGLLLCILAVLAAGPLARAARAEPSWTTYHRDAVRSGVDPDAVEPIEPVEAWHSAALGAPIWSQPLILGSRVYVATTGDLLYALDAQTGAVVWKRRLGTPVPAEQLPCGDVKPTVGVVGTPVIDPATNTIYAVADTWNGTTGEVHHVLKGFTVSGRSVLGTPVDPPGANPKTLLQRTALNLDKGHVVFGFGGNAGDCGEYRGTVVSAPESGGPPSFWQYQPAPPAGGGGAVWGPSGPAIDPEGRIYASTGNPNSGSAVETYDFSDSLIELDGALNRIGNFQPPTWLTDSNNDRDLGSSGPELLPGGLIFQAGKNGTGYLIDGAGLGDAAPAVFSHQVCAGHGSFGGDAYAGGVIYIPCTNGVQALAYDQVARTFTPLWQGPSTAIGPPILSAGLVWSAETAGFGDAGQHLYGLEPATGKPRYTITLPSAIIDHFGSPSAAGGRLFVATGSSVTAYQLSASPPPPAPSVETGAASEVTQSGAVLHGSVDPNGSAVSDCRFEYGTTTAYGASVPCSSLPGSGTAPVAVSAQLEGLAPGTTYHFRLVASGPGGTTSGQDATLLTEGPPPPPAPTVETGAASEVTQSGAVVGGSVDPNGSAVSDCRFEYGTTTAYGASVPCSSLPGSGTAPVAVSAQLAGLLAGTTYHFRLVATGPGGTRSGEDATFVTEGLPPPPPPVAPVPPAAVSATASSVTQTSAVLNGSVDPNGSAVSDCHFDYGSSEAYGASVPCSSLPGSGEGPVAVTAALQGLQAGSTYHFRLVAVGPGGTGAGADRTLTTSAPAPPPAPGGSVLGAPVASQLPALSVLPLTVTRPAAPLARVASALGIVDRAGRVILLVRCPGSTGACGESITLRTLHAVRVPGSRRAHRRAARRLLTLASGRFTIPAGRIEPVSLRLSRSGRALLARVHPLRARVTLAATTGAGAHSSSRATLTLRLAFGGR